MTNSDLSKEKINQIRNFYNKYGPVWISIFGFFKIFDINNESTLLRNVDIYLGDKVKVMSTIGGESFLEICKPNREFINYLIDSDGNFIDGKYIGSQSFEFPANYDLFKDHIQTNLSIDTLDTLDTIMIIIYSLFGLLRTIHKLTKLNYKYKIVFCNESIHHIKVIIYNPGSYKINLNRTNLSYPTFLNPTFSYIKR